MDSALNMRRKQALEKINDNGQEKALRTTSDYVLSSYNKQV